MMSFMESLSPPGRIHGDKHQRGMAIGRIRQSFINIGRQDRLDIAIKPQLEDQRRVVFIGGRGGQRKTQERHKRQEARRDPHPSSGTHTGS